jgi:hypothetical protein
MWLIQTHLRSQSASSKAVKPPPSVASPEGPREEARKRDICPKVPSPQSSRRPLKQNEKKKVSTLVYLLNKLTI